MVSAGAKRKPSTRQGMHYSMSIIDFSNVRFSYDGKRNALDGVTLAIEPGSFVCVLGGNGSGKSTLAKHINALLAPMKDVCS